jgi:hypothetical protein
VILDAEILRADAVRNHRIYGNYAISVFALRNATLDELAQEPQLVRFTSSTLMRAGEIRAAGLRLEATGRNLRHSAFCSMIWTPRTMRGVAGRPLGRARRR